MKESQIGDKEDTDSFSIRALLRATHEGLQRNLRKVALKLNFYIAEAGTEVLLWRD